MSNGPNFYAHLRISGSIDWTCAACGTVHKTRSFPAHAARLVCPGKNCKARYRIVVFSIVNDADAPDPRESFPIVPVVSVNWRDDQLIRD